MCPGDVLFVELHGESMVCEELEKTVRQIQDRDGWDVLVGFENVVLLTQSFRGQRH
jgi:hypothetical protein